MTPPIREENSCRPQTETAPNGCLGAKPPTGLLHSHVPGSFRVGSAQHFASTSVIPANYLPQRPAKRGRALEHLQSLLFKNRKPL